MPRLTYKGDTTDAFGRYLPTPVIDSIRIENFFETDDIFEDFNRLRELASKPPMDPADITKFEVSLSMLFNSNDTFDIDALIKELFDYSTGADGNNDSLYINLFFIKNIDDIDAIKESKFSIKDISLRERYVNLRQAIVESVVGPTEFDNTELLLDLYEGMIGPVGIISVPFSDYYNNITFTSDHDEDDNPIMRSSYVTITGYTHNFGGLQDMSIFAAVSTEPVKDLLQFSEATYALNLSDITYEDVVRDNRLAIFGDPAFVDNNNQFYPNTPIQTLNAKYHKIEDYGPSQIVSQINNITADYRAAMESDETLKDAIDGIDFVVQSYADKIEFLAKLNRYKELFPNKNGATATGRLYERYRRVVLNSNTALLGAPEVVKKIYRNYKIIDARATDFGEITSPSADIAITDRDLAYPVVIHSNIAKYVPNPDAADYPGSAEIGWELEELETISATTIDSAASAIRTHMADFFTGELRGRYSDRFSAIDDAAAALADWAWHEFGSRFVDDDFSWRVYVRSENASTALEYIRRSGPRLWLDRLDDEFGGVGPAGHTAFGGSIGDRFWGGSGGSPGGKGLRHAGEKQMFAIKEWMHGAGNGSLTLSVPTKHTVDLLGTLDVVEHVETIEDIDRDLSFSGIDDGGGMWGGLEDFMREIQENLGKIEVFETKSYDSGRMIFLLRRDEGDIKEDIKNLMIGALGAGDILEGDGTGDTTVLDERIEDAVNAEFETFFLSFESDMRSIYSSPDTSTTFGMTSDELTAYASEYVQSKFNNIMSNLSDQFVDAEFQFYLTSRYETAYYGVYDDYFIACQPRWFPAMTSTGPSVTQGVVYGNWQKAWNRADATGGSTTSITEATKCSQVNLLSAFTSAVESYLNDNKSAIAAQVKETIETIHGIRGTRIDTGGLSVLNSVDIVVKKAGYIFFDLEKYIRKRSYISKHVNVDRMLQMMPEALEITNNAIQMSEVTVTVKDRTEGSGIVLDHRPDPYEVTFKLKSPPYTEFDDLSYPLDFESLEFSTTNTDIVRKKITALDGGFRYSNFFSAGTGTAIDVDIVAELYGTAELTSHLVQRNYNFTKFADSNLTGGQTWRDNYRMLMYYYQFFIDDDAVYNGDPDDTKNSTDLLSAYYIVSDASYHTLDALIEKYTELYEMFIEDYYEPALEKCAYDQFNSQFNNFFVEGILTIYPNPGENPWFKMVAIHVLYVNMFTEVYNGDYLTMLDSANSILDQIRPETGRIEALMNFKLEAERFNDFLLGVKATSDEDIIDVIGAEDGIYQLKFELSDHEIKRPVIDHIGDFSDVDELDPTGLS